MSGLLVTLAAYLSFAPPAELPTAADAFPPVEIVAPAPRVELQTFEGDPIGVKQVVLDNGLTVLLSENHERPEVFGAVVVRTGGKNDPADNTGLAHYLEHMLFKGTQTLGTTNWEAEAPLQAKIVELYERHKRATSDQARAKLQAEIARVVEQTYAYAIPNELDRLLGEIGSSGVNAFTSEDETVYHNTFPASQIDKWLEIYAHRFVDPVFRLFPTELEAVYEEKNISLDSFEAALYDQFMARVFPAHPYGSQSLIGEVEHLERPSLEAMGAYFDEYYVANNMALVLAGDFDTQTILPLIERHFGAWRSGPQPQPRTGTVEPFVGRELFKERLTPLRAAVLGFRMPTASDPDYAALRVMHELLINDQGSGLIDNLVDEGKILMALAAPTGLADHGVYILLFAPRVIGQTFKGAEKRVLEQFHRVARGEFDERHMLALRDGLRRAEDRQWEANDERALAVADNFIQRDSWQDYLDYRERLANVTREDVMRVAATYFGDDYLEMRSRVGFPKQPQLDKPRYPTVTPRPGQHSSFYEQLMSRPSPTPQLRSIDFEADVGTTPLAERVVLRTNPNPFNDTYTLDLVFGVGTDAIRELRVVPDYIARIGTRSHSPTALREQLSALGTTFTVIANLDHTIVRLEGAERHLPEALGLLDELLRESIADRARYRAMRRERAAYTKIERQDPAVLVGAVGQYAMRGDSSMFLRDYGPKGLRKLDGEALLAAWQRAQAYELEIRYVGQRPPTELAQLLGDSLALGDPREPAVDDFVDTRKLAQRDTVYFLPRRKSVQTQLMFMVDGDEVAREQLAAAYAYSEYMGGSMTGLVFQEIREFRALAYSAWAQFRMDSSPTRRSYFIGGIGCQANKTMEAIDVMFELIRATPSKSEHLEALRSSLTRGLETGPTFRDLQTLIDAWQRRGYDNDPRQWLLEEFTRLSFEDLQAVHAAQVASRPITLVVVGDPRRVDLDLLGRYGEVIEVTEKQVFPP